MIRASSKPPGEVEQLDRLLDQCLEDTFPASDPISSFASRATPRGFGGQPGCWCECWYRRYASRLSYWR